MLEKGADHKVVDALKRTSLHWAAMAPNNAADACALLLEREGTKEMLNKQTKSGSTPLHSACSANRHDVRVPRPGARGLPPPPPRVFRPRVRRRSPASPRPSRRR